MICVGCDEGEGVRGDRKLGHLPPAPGRQNKPRPQPED